MLKYIAIIATITLSGFYIGRTISHYGAGLYDTNKTEINDTTSIERSDTQYASKIAGILSTVRTVDTSSNQGLNEKSSLKIGYEGTEIVAFTDVTCPLCAKTYSTARELAETGEYHFVFRHKVRYSKPQALEKHRALECGNLLNISKEIIFSDLSSSSLSEVIDVMRNDVQDSFTVDEFESCLSGENALGKKVTLILENDSLSAARWNIGAVPAWMINDQVGIGYFSSQIFSEIFAALDESREIE